MPAISPTSWAAVSVPQPSELEQLGRLRPQQRRSARARARRRVRESSRQRPTSSRAIRTCTVCSRAGEAAAEPVEPDRAGQAQPVAISSSGSRSCRCQRSRFWIRVRSHDQVGAVVVQQAGSPDPALASCAAGKARLPQRRACDRERVDRVRLAALACRCAAPPAISRGGTRTTRSPRAEQKPLQRAGDMPAVLERPQPLTVEPARPRQAAARGPPAARSPSAQPHKHARRPPRQRPRCASACADQLRLRSLPVPFPLKVATDRAPADRPQWGRLATLLSGHAGAPRTAAGDRSRARSASSRPTASYGSARRRLRA